MNEKDRDPEETTGRGRNGGASLLDTLESYLKFAVGAGILIAALGVPAVNTQFSRLNVPAAVPYDQALRAGVAPALVLMLAGWYLLRGVRLLAGRGEGSWGLVLSPLIPALPLMIVWAVVYFFGALSLALLAIDAIVTGIARVLGFSPSRLDRLLISLGVLVVSGVLIASLRRSFIRVVLRRTGTNSEPRRAEPTSEIESTERRDALSPLQIVGVMVLVPAATLGFAFVLRAALRRFGWSATWFDSELIFVVFGVSVVAWGLFAATLSLIPGGLQGRHATAGLVVSVGMAYVAAASLYACAIYPRLPQSFGGGRPTPVVLWTAIDDIPHEVVRQLPRSRFSVSGRSTRMEGVFVVYSNSSILVLTDRQQPPAQSVVLPRQAVQALGSAG